MTHTRLHPNRHSTELIPRFCALLLVVACGVAPDARAETGNGPWRLDDQIGTDLVSLTATEDLGGGSYGLGFGSGGILFCGSRASAASAAAAATAPGTGPAPGPAAEAAAAIASVFRSTRVSAWR